MRVQRAYMVGSRAAERVLAADDGRVYLPRLEVWTSSPLGDVVRTGEVFERWVDVPSAWVGHAVWFPSVSR